jgi:outer membrane protein assembly factor BamB
MGRLMALGLLSVSSSAADWPQLQGDPGHRGYAPDEPSPPYRLLWRRDLEEPTQSAAQPVVAGSRLFVGTGHGNLHALDRDTGQTLWTYRTGAPIFGSAACGDGIVYVNSLDRCCHAVREADGSRLWKYETGAPIWASPVVADGRVFVAGRDRLVRALDPSSGEELWRSPVPSLVMSTPAWDQGVLYVAVGDMRVHAFDGATGRPLWQSEQLPGSAIREYWVVAAGGNVIVTVDHGIPLRTHWREIQQEVMVPFIAAHQDDEVLVEDGVFRLLEQRFREHPEEQSIFVLDANDGRQKFIVPLIPVEGGGGTPIPPAVDPQGRAYFMYGNIHLSASGNAFFGRLHLDSGRMEPLLKDRFAGPSHLTGFPGHQPRPGVEWPHGRGDFYGGFCVMDQSWAVSVGGQIAFPVRDPSWPFEAPFHNWHHLETGEGGYVAGDLSGQRRLGGTGIYGGGMHSTCSPVVIVGKQLFHKSPRSVLYAFSGK